MRLGLPYPKHSFHYCNLGFCSRRLAILRSNYPVCGYKDYITLEFCCLYISFLTALSLPTASKLFTNSQQLHRAKVCVVPVASWEVSCLIS